MVNNLQLELKRGKERRNGRELVKLVVNSGREMFDGFLWQDSGWIHSTFSPSLPLFLFPASSFNFLFLSFGSSSNGPDSWFMKVAKKRKKERDESGNRFIVSSTLGEHILESNEGESVITPHRLFPSDFFPLSLIYSSMICIHAHHDSKKEEKEARNVIQ